MLLTPAPAVGVLHAACIAWLIPLHARGITGRRARGAVPLDYITASSVMNDHRIQGTDGIGLHCLAMSCVSRSRASVPGEAYK